MLVPVFGTDSEWDKNVVVRLRVRLTIGQTEVEPHQEPVGRRAGQTRSSLRFVRSTARRPFDRFHPKLDAAGKTPLT